MTREVPAVGSVRAEGVGVRLRDMYRRRELIVHSIGFWFIKRNNEGRM